MPTKLCYWIHLKVWWLVTVEKSGLKCTTQIGKLGKNRFGTQVSSQAAGKNSSAEKAEGEVVKKKIWSLGKLSQEDRWNTWHWGKRRTGSDTKEDTHQIHEGKQVMGNKGTRSGRGRQSHRRAKHTRVGSEVSENEKGGEATQNKTGNDDWMLTGIKAHSLTNETWHKLCELTAGQMWWSTVRSFAETLTFPLSLLLQ